MQYPSSEQVNHEMELETTYPQLPQQQEDEIIIALKLSPLIDLHDTTVVIGPSFSSACSEAVTR